MKLAVIVSRLNQLLADEHHTYSELTLHLDSAIDAVNSKLNSKFPAFSELAEGVDEYTYFPDQYIRSVVLPGAAWHYFTTDEEGISTAPQYQMDFEKGLFLMLRDYFNYVPEEYQSTDLKALVMYNDLLTGESGVSVYGISLLP